MQIGSFFSPYIALGQCAILGCSSADVALTALPAPFRTNGEAAAAAAALGFRKINQRSMGQAVFTDGKMYITRDIKGHRGGAWKGADSVKNLRSETTRSGTYDRNLNWIAP